MFQYIAYLLLYDADMRRDVQEIFRMTPHEKQVMMFSATLSKDIRPVCKKFMQDVSRPLPHCCILLRLPAKVVSKRIGG